MASEYEEPEELRIVLLGGSGSGKSATGNTILGKRAFTTRQPLDPETLSCQAERGEFEGTPVYVVDTPWTIRRNSTEMSKCMSYCAPGPHAFLLVIPLEKCTDVERQVKNLQQTFGEYASRYTIVLFTGGDELPNGVTAEEFICQSRPPYGVGYHVFNNRSEDPSQVRELLEKINSMVQRNGGSYYIKTKDWKQKYLYLFASAVTIGCGIGAASGGTGGVLVTFLGSVIGAIAAADGGKRAVAGAIAVVLSGAVTGPVSLAGFVALASFGLVAFYVALGVSVTAAVVAEVIPGSGSVSGSGSGFGSASVSGVGVVAAGVVGFSAALGDAVYIDGAAALGFTVALRAGVLAAAGIAAKTTVAIIAGAGTARAAFEAFDDIGVRVGAKVGIIGGAGVGAGGSVAVGLYADYHFFKAVVPGFTALIGVVIVLTVLLLVFKIPSSISKVERLNRLAIVSLVSAGAAFGAAVGIRVSGEIITILCEAVEMWLNGSEEDIHRERKQ